MLKWIAKKQVGAFERRWNYDAGYVREIIDEAGLSAALPLQALEKVSSFRRGAPLAAYYGAKLTAAKHADCGPCLQLAVSMAQEEGLSPGVIRAILQPDYEQLSHDALLGIELALATIERDGSGDDARQEIVQRWGALGLVSLAYGIVAAQAYPAFKYAIGRGHTCARVLVDGNALALREPEYA